MDQYYRILLIENELLDAELNISEIKKVLPFCKFEIVDNRNSYLELLESYLPNIIISDYNMPAFDGLSALKIAREIHPLTPFIVVTDSINEDTAVECMKAGATDYVLKDSLKRLGSSVLNALEQCKIRKERMEAFETIKLNESKYRYMFHNNPQPMWIYDVESLTFMEVNKAAVKHYGYTQEEFLSMTLKDIRPKSEIEKFIKNIESADKQPDRSGEWTHKKKNGELISVEIVSHSIIFNHRNARHVLINDITERKKVEEKLISERKLLRTLIDNLPLAIYIKDVECRKIIANRTDLEIVGAKSEKEILGKTDLETFSNEIGKRGYTDDKKVIETGIPILNIEEDFYDITGVQRLLLTSKIPLTDENGKIIGLVGTGRDITEQKKVEEKLISERKLLRTLIDNLPVNIYVKDAECRKVIANRADLEVIGAKSEEDVLGKTDLELFCNDIGKRGYADDKKVIDAGETILNREEDFYDINRIQRWLLTSKIPLTDKNGKIIGLVGIGLDITEQKLAQQKILKLSKGMEQSPTSIIITDVNGTIEYVNPRFCEVTGYSEEEVIGKKSRIQRSGKMSAEIYQDLWKTITSGKIWRNELLNKKKDGSLFWESVILTSIKNDKGVIINYIAIKEDISARKQMEAELISAKEKAEESDRLKSAFLANMSHEIRTPLNSIIGFSELLSDPDFDQDQKDEFIHTIIDNGNNLLVIISDIMDFSMLESGQMKIRKDVISTRKLLNDLINDFSKKATLKGIEIRIDHSFNNPDIGFESDSYRIRQIFNNLIGNALKFTHEGYIEIGYKIQDGIIEFHIKDTGIGIAPENHQAIFERFRQVDTARTRKYGGNGLGLAITKNLVRLLGGNIWVESEPDKFSDFFFTIPISSKNQEIV